MKGDKIQATIPVNLIDQFSDRLSVGTWKYLSHFEVHTETRTIRNTKHKFRIFFNLETMVRPSHKTCNNQFYDFESFESILNHNFNGINHSIGTLFNIFLVYMHFLNLINPIF